MSVFNLPRLQDLNSNMPPPSKPGIWQRIDDLSVISQSLDTGGQEFSLNDVKSIPTLWGRIAVFEDALSDGNHLAYADAVSKWRALITLLALRDDKSYNSRLKTKKLILSSDHQVESMFVDLVDKQRPQRTMDGENGWSTLYLLVWEKDGQDHLIGTLSPSTLVAPARSPNLHGLNQPWMKVDKPYGLDIVDPLTDPTWLTPDQMKVVSSYLNPILADIKTRSQNNPTTIGLIKVIESYLKDLHEQEGGAAISEIKTSFDEFIPDLAKGSVLSALNTSLITKAPDKLITDCLLKTDVKLPGVTSGLKILLADRKLTNQRMYDRTADRISLVNENMLGGTRTVEQIRTETHKLNPDVLILSPEDIFNQFLTPMEGANVANHPVGLESYLLPFKPAIFLLMDEDELKSRITVHGANSDRVKVVLKVDMIDRSGNVRQHHMSQEYNLKDGDLHIEDSGRLLAIRDGAEFVQTDAPLALAAWPNFRAEFWTHNYLYTVSQPGYSPVVTSGLSREVLLADISDLDGATSIYDRLNSWAGTNGPWQDHTPPSWMKVLEIEDPKISGTHQSNKKTLQKSAYPFTAAACSVQGNAVGFETPQAVFAGIGLLERAELIVPNESKARVAIDFGTTNTTVYVKSDGRSKAVTFTPRLRKCSISEGASAVSNYRSFMPAKEVVQPFTTVVQVRSFRVEGGVKSATSGQENELLFQDYAFFDDDLTDMLHFIADPSYGGGTLRFGLKWSEAAADISVIARYIGHLGLLSLAELAASGVSPDNVEWLFSYPMSMKEGGQGYRNIIKHQALTSFNVDPNKISFVTESDAALSYFRSVQGIEASTRLVLDVGGGTTDIGIVVADKPVWRHSLQIAGADLVGNFIGHNRSFIQELGLDKRFPKMDNANYDFFANSSQKFVRKADNPIQKAVNAIVNTQHYAESFQKAYPAHSGEKNFKTLKSGAFLMLGGLLYYTGMQTRSLVERNILPNREGLFEEIDICFAGRGCSLFSDLKELEDYGFRKLLKLFYAGLQAPEGRIRSTFADNVKHEAAAGMIEIESQELKELNDRVLESDGRRDARVLGAEVDVYVGKEGSKLLELSDLTDITPSADTEIREVGMVEFIKFIEILKDTTGLSVNVIPASSGISQKALIELNRAAGSKTGADMHSVNPPFIEMLKESLKLLYKGEHVSASWKN